MNRYKLTNTETGEVVEREAELLDQALREVGWNRAACLIEILPASSQKVANRGVGTVPADEKKEAVKRTASRKKKTPEQGTTEEGTGQTEEKPLVPDDAVEKARAVAKADQADADKATQSEKKLKKEIDKIDVHALSGDPTEAEKTAYGHKQAIEALAIGAEVMFLKMGQLLYGARIAGEWTILHYETYREYVEDLKLPMTSSYSWATRLSAIYEYLVKNMGLDEKLLAEIGVAKLTRLLPLARKGELTMEVIEAARILSDLDLREELGQNVGGDGDDKPDNIVCPRCGEVINSKTATRV